MRVFVLVAMLLLPSLAGAQSIAGTFIRQSWGTAQGLPQNSVTAILQTRDGYLWIGTFGGLVRFDGHTFTVFEPGATPGLASARIVRLYEDRDGILWIATEAGLTRYEAGRFVTYGMRDGLSHDGIWSMLEDRRGRLWVGTGGAPSRFDGKTFERVPLATPGSIASVLVETPDGDVWVSTNHGIERFVGGERRVTVQDGPAGGSLFVDSRGTLWAATHVLRRWDGTRFVEVPLGVPPATYDAITSIAEDRDGSLWLGTVRGGVMRWRDGVTETYTTADGLTNAWVRSLHIDRDGSIWIGTDVGGLNRLKRRRVFSYTREGSAEQSIGPIVGDGSDGLWIGATCGGLWHFRAGVLRPHENNARLHPCIWALHRDDDGTIWLGSTGGGLTRLRGSDVRTYTMADGLPGELVSAIARGRDGTLWVGTDKGLARVTPDGFTTYGPDQGMQERILSILPSRDGALWIGGTAGLTRFRDGQSTTFAKAQGLSHELVRSLHEDADGVLWIGTYGGGLNRLENGHFTHYGIAEGLHDNAVSRILEDDRGNLWMSGNKGVYRVARRQLNDFAAGRIGYVTSVSYGTADGMIIDETNGGSPAGWRTRDGRLWFPTIKGLVGIEPAAGAPTAPSLFLERAVADGRDVDPRTSPQMGPGATDLELHYTAVDLAAAEKTRFRYRLVGYDDDWVDAGSRRVAYYPRLPPGRYDFTVIATDSDGVWSASPLRVAIVVRPFWWQRPEVMVAAVFVLMAMTGLGARHLTLRRGRARLEELERAQALDRERSRIARDLHDDLGTRLSHIAILAGAGDPGRRIEHEALAAAQTMDELVWAVNATNDTIESFASYIAQFAEEHIVPAGLRCRLLLPSEIPPRPLGAEVRRHLFLAVKEAIANALKHAKATEVLVSVRVEPRTLTVAVGDDGIGLPADVDPTGNGLTNFRERMRLAGGAVGIESAPGQGTRLTFTVPLPPAEAHEHARDAEPMPGTE